MKINYIIAALIVINSTLCFGIDDPASILKKVDDTRGPSFSTYQTTIEVITTEKKVITEQNKLTVIIQRGNDSVSSIAFFETPEDQKGRKMLMVGTDTWLYIPGSKKPVKISPAQKLSGNASTGDILSVNYSGDYTPSITGNEKIGNFDCVQLELIAAKKSVTYYKIILWVDKKEYKPVKAEYYTKSLKLLKTAYFRKFEMINNKEICTESIIVDAIFNDKVTIIKNYDFRKSDKTQSYFSKDFIKDVSL
ncbi:MAG: hypothetical protein A2015_08300 [Spirochaetes bacterium GWF1_31_7]|nr:MAG: hypothetical protein A2Y30_08495 [Spirochaetes bacterium GWE1_32_154]OHD47149.1 MAG: hypothetical protein A2015_08300 [Spirochaetes bacterium GWF1_31_7]OHD47458.1 MAG: hypothetical protein A2Y29_08720 [Spirochaetes bacterium GWE2_31_10]OHD81817.1 MAG: hypothetical protein A2355_02535 [Spirochaetes bacterium RIFOXYB1_FULL_32_8]HBD94943.1 hypothetical protein [Spirochaetia bacterium]